MKIHELKYANTNTYLIEGGRGRILFDTGWAGTFPAFCRAMGELGVPVQGIDYILISHFHPDHMGIAQEIAQLGPVIAAMDVQTGFMHASDAVFAKDRGNRFVPIRDERVKVVPLSQSRAFLRESGIDGEILHTPGHSDDGISLCLDSGMFFVGDLNPLYELALHRGTEIEESWRMLLERRPKVLYYGHAAAADLRKQSDDPKRSSDLYDLTARIMKYIDRGVSVEKIIKKTGADRSFAEDVARMYLTHQNVGVQGILDRIEIKNR